MDFLKFPSTRCSARPNDKSTSNLRTFKTCKTQHNFGGRMINERRNAYTGAYALGQDTTVSAEAQRVTEAYAIGRHIPISADKARRVIDQIRGRSYEETLMILELMPYRACYAILNLVVSAASNASHNLGLSKANLTISKAVVNEGTTRKKLKPQARGRGFPIRRRTCHITVGVKGPASDS
ncbi:50S ribosomal protein L22, chloroplastic [Quillaja saponaria]|uniref:Large ribosomal subunit protein uL22c n=1 Tax=Quillaja saponaria TaxID=32244 RepID=A0AAD7PY07_QUISA|nr:50S ribosomal protein L22, chloroplastic [Quillaja saponaria]